MWVARVLSYPCQTGPQDRLAEGSGGDDAAGVLVQFAEQLQLLGGEGADLPVPVGGGVFQIHLGSRQPDHPPGGKGWSAEGMACTRNSSSRGRKGLAR